MGRNLLIDLRRLLIMLDDLPKALTAHALAAHIDKQSCLFRVGNQLRADVAQIVRESLDSRRIERNHTFLPFALTAHKSRAEAHVLFVERNQLRHTDAGGVKLLQHSMVAISFGIYALRLIQKELNFMGCENFRKLPLNVFGRDAFGRVGFDLAPSL